jgi:multicomponent Na+:H+ antiporter subunit B
LTDCLVLALLVATAFAIMRLRGLFATVMLMGIYSLLSASWMVVLDAPDVAFTEAAVGSGVSTVLLLAAVALVRSEEREPTRAGGALLPLVTVLVTGAALIYATLDMPHFGDPQAPAHVHVAPRYLHESAEEVGPDNVITSVLGSYRGFDTLGETVVVFTAGIAVIALLAGAGAGRQGERP